LRRITRRATSGRRRAWSGERRLWADDPARLARRDYLASWKITPSVCRRPSRSRLTPWRMLTR
jgi:hypothetical protein